MSASMDSSFQNQEMKNYHSSNYADNSNFRYMHEERKLFIGGLSWDTNVEDLTEFFSKYGPVTQALIKYNAATGKPRGFGFILMETEEAVEKILSSGPHEIKGKVIEPKRVKLRPISKKIFVGGVDSNLDENQIKSYFSKYGPVEGIELPFDHQRLKRREFCFVIFETEEAADAACSQNKQVIGGKECDIKKAQPQLIAQEQKRLAQIQPNSTDFNRKKSPKARSPQVNRNDAPSVVQASFPYNGFIAPNIAPGYNFQSQPINGFYGPQPSYFNYAQPPFEMYQFQNYAPTGITSYDYFYAQQLALQQVANQANASAPQQMIQIAGNPSTAQNPAPTPVSGPITYAPTFTILDQQLVHPSQSQISHQPPQASHLPVISPMVHSLHQPHPHMLAHQHHQGTSNELISCPTDANPNEELSYSEMPSDAQSPASINGNLNPKIIASRKPLPHNNYHGYKPNPSQPQ